MSYFKTGQEWLEQSALLIQASPNTTRVTTRYSIKAVKRRKPSTPEAKGAASTTTAAEKPPRGTLVIKTFDPVTGVTLRYRTTKAAEVSRLMGAAMGELSRSMAALPSVVPDVAMPDAAAAADEADEQSQPQPQPQHQKEQQQPSAPTAGGGGGGGKKKRKGKK